MGRLMNKELLIFDLDGTLIDSSSDIAWAANRVLLDMGYKEEDADYIKANIGWGVKALLEKLLPFSSAETIDRARDRFLEFYSGHLVVDTRLYPGVRETLEYFRNARKKMAIVTNKPEKVSEKILDIFALRDLFQVVVGGDTCKTRKPSPEPVQKVLGVFNVVAGSAVIIGDSPIDAETGFNAGIDTIGVPYGYRGGLAMNEAGFDLTVDDFASLKDLIT